MYYKIIKTFSPEDDRWESYIGWRKLKLVRFDSVDGILRPNLFKPESNEDWANCVNENFKLNLITNLPYAEKVLKRYDNADLVGVEIELDKDYVAKDNLLGFDIIEGECVVSLITNWGNDEEGLFTNIIMDNGLIGELGKALEIRDMLRERYPNDHHAGNCQVWGVFRINKQDEPMLRRTS